ncbi:hypothetical protein IFM89_002761 [Coptis chinensis]|uniref:Uncharacterized protein n=1 Tax=Coptis chinensis TaxID=261450 RepID=A0A835HSL5_9MAGN|nr:hypothetical protein IFM89_002761 [Coptis chinensis]
MVDAGLCPNVTTCNSLHSVFLRAHRFPDAYEVLQSMLILGLQPSLQTYQLFLSCFTDRRIHGDMTFCYELMTTTAHATHAFLVSMPADSLHVEIQLSEFTFQEWVHNVPSSGGNGNMKPPGSLRKLILFSGNNYLGFSSHPTVRMAAAEADLVSSFSSLNDFVEENDEKERKDIIIKYADVATLGNLCVDVVLSVPTLSPPSFEERRAYMDKLSSSKPDKLQYAPTITYLLFFLRKDFLNHVKANRDIKLLGIEASGNCNMVIAAARIGLSYLSLGHVGDEIYGLFLLDVLHDEGIGMVEMSEDTDANAGKRDVRVDFSKDPAFGWMSKLFAEVKSAIKRSKILFCNGYSFGLVKNKLPVDQDNWYLELSILGLRMALALAQKNEIQILEFREEIKQFMQSREESDRRTEERILPIRGSFVASEGEGPVIAAGFEKGIDRDLEPVLFMTPLN